MNLSKLQVDCLNAMGIELWQARADLTTEPAIPAEPVETAGSAIEDPSQPPLLVAQLQRAFDYCQQHNKEAVTLSWKIDHGLEQIELAGTQLSLPGLTKVFASAKLKQQLWQHIYHAKNT